MPLILLLSLRSAAGWVQLGALPLRSTPGAPSVAIIARLPNDVDLELAKCDMSVLAMLSLGRTIWDTVANGSINSVPGITQRDLVEISGAFNDAASSALGWVVAAVLLSGTGVLKRPLERSSAKTAQVVVLVFCLAGPISLTLKSISLALIEPNLAATLSVLACDVHDLPFTLVLLLGWRVILAPAVMF
ncbi:hypothetical protein T492DRAFT_1051396 [Pavlovales sp. CCMP2436]|nr:hypothetical protein T492DRAFT_1051396 [Pavlovales sp. CCMP2436]